MHPKQPIRLARHVLFFIFSLTLSVALSQNDALNTVVKFETRTISVAEVLATIERASQIRFSYTPKQIPSGYKMVLSSKELTIKSIVDKLCNELNLTYSRKGNLIIIQKEKVKGRATLSGVIIDQETGELIPGAQLVLTGTTDGTETNKYGFFSITQEVGRKQTIDVRFMGYENSIIEFDFKQDSALNIFLSPKKIELNEVVVVASSVEREQFRNSTGSHSFTGKEIKQIPTFGGIADPLKALQFLPGVQTGNEGTTSFSVRGGSFDQNLFLLDEAPVYNPSHALSFFSVFNADAIKQTDIYKSSIPVRYGGRLSSVVDIQMADGNRKKNVITGSIGAISSQLMIEGPLKKGSEKLSYMLAARYSYAGATWNTLTKIASSVFNSKKANSSRDDNEVSFYDFNAKVNYRKSDRDQFYLSGYSGGDHFYATQLTNGYALNWGNTTGTLRWNHVYNPKLFCNTTAVFSNYNYQYKLLNDTRLLKWTSQLQEISVKQDYDYFITANHALIVGWSLEKRRIDPGEISPQQDSAVMRPVKLPRQHNIGAFLYVGHKWDVYPGIQVNYGLRYSNFNRVGPGIAYSFAANDDFPYDSIEYNKNGEIIKSYSRLDPRMSVSFNKDKKRLTLSYDRTTQFLHLLSNSSIGLPTDVWMSSSRNVKPQFANIYSARFQTMYTPLAIEWSVGAYWKKMFNTIDFKDNANLFVNKYVESQILQGSGKAYGLEIQVGRKTTKWEANLSYTLSKVLYRIPGINQDKAFPTRFDKRHNLAMFGTIHWSSRWETSLNFVYSTGGALTLPNSNIIFDDRAYNDISFNTYTTRNGYRLPSYHRMDVGIKYHQRKNENRKWKGYWSLDIYNVYGKKNPFMFFSLQEDHNFEHMNFSTVYLFGIVPTVSYNFTF